MDVVVEKVVVEKEVPVSTRPDAPPHRGIDGPRAVSARAVSARAARSTVVALRQLAGGLGTALLALMVLVLVVVTGLTSPVGVGLVVAPVTLKAVRAVANRERSRLTRWGPAVVGPAAVRPRLRHALDTTTRRELRWLARHATLGLVLGLIAVLLPLFAVRDASFPLWWWLVPDGQAAASLGWAVRDWAGAFAVALLGCGWIAIAVGLGPAMARLQSAPGRRLLPPDGNTDLPLRIAELTATRAAALDAHVAELRRIERSLHDGTQNRLVAVTVLLGAARRASGRDPSQVDALLERAQSAAEQALTELRAVVRTILPPVLADRGLASALTGLAATCPVPCRVEVHLANRCAASVESTAYFVAAEALTNISRHSGARHAAVTATNDAGKLVLEITDDGRGGADERHGSGLVGIRQRIDAHDGTLTLTSPAGGPTTLLVELPCGS